MGDDSHVAFDQNSLVEKEVWDSALLWCNSQFFLSPKFGAHFYAVAVKCHSSIQNGLFRLQGWIFCEQTEHAIQTSLYSSSFFPERLVITARSPVHFFPKMCSKFDAHLLSDPFQNRVTSNKWTYKIRKFTQLYEIVHTDFKGMLVLSSTVASHYNCCTDGRISPGNYGYPHTRWFLTVQQATIHFTVLLWRRLFADLSYSKVFPLCKDTAVIAASAVTIVMYVSSELFLHVWKTLSHNIHKTWCNSRSTRSVWIAWEYATGNDQSFLCLMKNNCSVCLTHLLEWILDA
jgi:hypothetical protein